MADAACYGRFFIANPDLPARIKAGAAMNPLRSEVIYATGAEGYTDYPALA